MSTQTVSNLFHFEFKESLNGDDRSSSLCAQSTTPVHCCSDHIITPNSLPLDHTVIFFDYIVVEGKRFYASRMVGWNRSSLVRVLIPGPLPIDAYGEVLEILQIGQDFRNVGYPLWLAWMRWFKRWSQERDQIWDEL